MLLSQESQKMRQVVLLVSFVLSVAAQSSIKKTELSREAFDPCNSGNYQTLNSSDRLVGNTDQRSLKCDKRDLIRGWYRFTGDAGDKMPNRRPTSTRRCGTHAPGWIDGGNPSVAAGEVTRKVCYYWSGVDCRWNNNIKVKNCGAFFVYKLRKPPVCWLRYCGEASECSNYTSLDQSDRAVGNTDQSNLKCDKWAPDNIVPGWYRMTGASGDQIPEGCVPIRRCGTHAPGWLNDTHPTVKDGLLTAKVCYHWSNKCCRWSNNIKIRNCGSYYVYQLVKPPVCYLRYCGNKNAPLNTSPAPTTAAFDPCTSGNYQTLSSSDRLVSNTNQSSLKCDRYTLIPGWYRFTGDAGDGMPSYCPPIRRCGTHATGWLNGSYPTLAEGAVTRKVCYHWSNKCCRWSNNIKIKNCNGYYVYRLAKPPVCHLRYCGNGQGAPLNTSPAPTTAAFDPCTSGNYQTLSSSDRLVSNTNQSSLKCDRYTLIPGWYRFTGDAGDGMPSYCPPIRRCGTHATGWLNGSYPTLAEGAVTRKVCYHWSNKCCRWSNNIKIKNCNGYYVYRLAKPPVCHLRYCGNGQGAPLNTSPAPTTAAFDPCTSGNYQTLSSSDRLVSNTNQSSLKCDRYTLIPGWYRFTGDAGDGMPSYCPPIRRCGTHATGWLNGSYPTLAEGAVTRKVCYHWSNKCCRWSNNIKIKNCNGYYVYRLAKPPVCHLRYCGNGQGAPLNTSPAPTTAAFDPCTSGNYQTLSSSDRLVSNTNQSSLKCDRYTLIPGWYRFTGDAGDGMPSYCPPIRRCGTHATGWLNGSYPTLAEGAVTRKVCYHWSNKCCRWSNNIKIKNCNGYYVYRLAKPPVCHLRYCGNGQGAPLNTSPAPTTAAFDPCTSGNYQTLSSSDRLVSNTNQSSLKCDRYTLIPGWYRFTGDAGDGMPSYCPPIRRCGTHATGWLNGSYPTLAEGAVTRKVCYHWSNKCCRWSNNIKIKNCNGYYVYRLAKPPVCHLRYCGNGQGAPLNTSPAPTTAAFDPCTSGNYQTLSSSDRLVSNTNQSSLKCDRYTLIPGWYRFTGDAGDGMPSYCPPIRRCGTHATGWLNGSYPTLAEGAVTRKVCYHWSNKCCRWSNNIKIKNCNGYYVYRLAKPPVCHLRYCGNGQGAPLNTSPAPTTAAFDPCTSGNYQTLSSSDRLVSNTNQSSLKCDRYTLIPGWYRFTGDAGDGMPSYCLPIRRCGTHATGWLNGSYPTLAEGAVTRKVCYHWSNKCCRWSNNIKIKNCNGYYVYRLAKPPACHLRYCGNGQSQKTSPATTQLFTTPSSYTSSVPANPPGQEEVNVTCGNNEMWINLPKSLLSGLDRDHLRLLDANCGAEETRTQFVLYTKLTECETISKHTRGFVLYSNKVLQIPLKKKRIITRVREVEIPFSCYYSNTGVVSAVGIKVQSKKILFSKKGFGRFVLEMNIFPDNRYVGFYGKKDFPLIVSLRKLLYVQVKVESEDKRLAIIAEECFATPDANPLKPGLKYMFIKDGCAVDETVAFIPSGNEHLQRYSIEAFTFLGDHEFVYLHCRVKICNATDPNSRCAQGCIPQRGRRSALIRGQSEDDEANLAEGPFTRKHEDGENSQLQETDRELKDTDKTETGSTISVAIIAMTVVSSIGVLFLLYFVYEMRKQRQFNQENSPLSVPVHD
ncbi:uncharacterized protein [Acropora muricata]|uniref:uncharacterized protein n=1 Tax=Acropora muricata TaxID=159855 RepID=UPI0034E53FA1